MNATAHHTAIYPGTFDPLTNGHLDIIKRSCEIFERVIVAIAHSRAKNPLFTIEQRLTMARLATSHLPNLTCIAFGGLLADLAKEHDARILIRGLRVVSDFEYELQMGYTNASLNPELDTIYFMPTLQNAFISSSIVRNILEHGGRISHLIPEPVHAYITQESKKAPHSRKLESTSKSSPRKPESSPAEKRSAR